MFDLTESISFASRGVKIDDPFWSPRLKVLSEITLRQQFDQIANQTGRLRNFQRVVKGESGAHEGRYYDDSDVYKWVEACAYALRHHACRELKNELDTVIGAIVSAQEDSGYINTFFQLNHPDLKFRNLSFMHEMYCMGHLIEAAVALDESLGDPTLIPVAQKISELLWNEFGPNGRPGYCGHEEIELALLRFSSHSGDKNAFELARLMIERRGQKPGIFEAELQDEVAMSLSPWAKTYLNLRGDYFQDHAPIREHRDVVGHAVRAMYLYRAALRISKEDSLLETALKSVWDNMISKRMYVTGGIGSTAKNEGFTRDFDLPNYQSYAETCASVGLALWGFDMANSFGDADYVDVAERALFNGALAGISSSGDAYFYANPLESRGLDSRVPWFECACCPPNIARLIGSIDRYAYRHSKDQTAIIVNFPIAGQFKVGEVTFTVTSNYPASGEFTLKLDIPSPTELTFAIRIPGWCDSADLEIKGVEHEAEFESGYAIFSRKWSSGDEIFVNWEVEPKWIESNPFVFDNLGKVALQIGPLVYAHESLDSSIPAQFAVVDVSQELNAHSGLGPIEVAGYQVISDSDELYVEPGQTTYEPTRLEFIPYFSWANQGPSTMCVWVRATESE